MNKAISVIIPTYNRSAILAETLKSVCQQTLKLHLFEIIIVDTCSTDDTKNICRDVIQKNKNLSIKYHYSDVPGLLAGRHIGAKMALGEIHVFIDDDITVPETWLEIIVDSFSDPQLALLGGKSLPLFEVEPAIKLPYHSSPYGGNLCSSLSLIDLGDKAIEIHPNYIWGLNFSIRKKILFELDGFHPDAYPPELLYLRGDGETGLTMKSYESGLLSRYNPENVVIHRIPKNRLTFNYLEHRDYLQGISDSYSEIRKNISITKNRSLNRSKSYIKGYLYHQEQVDKNPQLLQWVLRKSYWDYSF